MFIFESDWIHNYLIFKELLHIETELSIQSIDPMIILDDIQISKNLYDAHNFFLSAYTSILADHLIDILYRESSIVCSEAEENR